MQWLQDPNQSNVDNSNNVIYDTTRHFRNKKTEYLKATIDELESNGKIKNIRDLYMAINDFNHLTPNGHFSGRTAPLTSRRFIFYLINKYTYQIF
jgi:tRNA A37 threonylcarbamoyladenosine dehydratase